jgi:hypothetical protein
LSQCLFVASEEGNLVGAAKEGLLAPNVVALSVLRESMEAEVVDEVVGPKASRIRTAARWDTVTTPVRPRSAGVGSGSAGHGRGNADGEREVERVTYSHVAAPPG